MMWGVCADCRAVVKTLASLRHSECRRRVDPNQHSFFVGRIEPAMPQVALEPEAVSFAQEITILLVQPDFQFTRHHVNELFAGMRIRPVASGPRSDAEQ